MKIGLFCCLWVLGCCKIVPACSCTDEGTVSTSFHDSDFVLLGTIIRVDFVELGDLYHLKREYKDEDSHTVYVQYTLMIEDVFKGHVKSDTIHIYSDNYNSYFFKFLQGYKYIIYGSDEMLFDTADHVQKYSMRNKNHIWVYECSGTGHATEDEIQILKMLSTQN